MALAPGGEDKPVAGTCTLRLTNRAGAACSVGWSRCSHLGQLDYHDMKEMGLLDFMGAAAYHDLMGLC